MRKSNISVVITCYKEGHILLDAVYSVFRQSLLPLEIILVKDASNDIETKQACHTLSTDDRVNLIELQENRGPSVARNVGFSAAQGEILVPLDADDLLPEDALKNIQLAFSRFPDAGFIHGSYIRQDSTERSHLVTAKTISLNTMLRAKRFSLSSNWTLIGTAPLRKRLWEEIGHSDPSLDASDLHDLEFWLRAMALPCQHFAIPEVIYIWRKYLGSNSRKVTPLSWYRIADKHFDTYKSIGLEYRAHELLLLGSKWLGNRQDISYFRQRLIQSKLRGQSQASSFMALLLPTPLFRLLAKYLGRRR